MEKINRSCRRKDGTPLLETGLGFQEAVLDKLDEIVDWINEQEATKEPERKHDNGNT